VLPGAVPHLIDEWQLVPESWNAVRAEIDTRQESGRFILTGSATPAEDITRHSGAGRFRRVRMGPMSLFESHDSAGGSVSAPSWTVSDLSHQPGRTRRWLMLPPSCAAVVGLRT
jgi:predicted AAA+ superfamily ATPase